MTDWVRLFVSHSQYEVFAAPGPPGLKIYTIGDDLLHVGGASRLTGFCGIHTGWIEARARVRSGPPARVPDGWASASEATLWCPHGHLSVVGLMGNSAEALTDVAVPRGLIRVRLQARNRLDEGVRTDGDPPEQHEILIWPVSEESPWRTLLADRAAQGWEQQPARAVEWAMLSLVSRPPDRPLLLPDPHEQDTGLPRVTVVRRRPVPVEVPVGVLPAGDLEVRLERVDDETLTWSWATSAQPMFPRPLTTLPDGEPSTVRLTAGPDGFTLRHEGVLGRHAAALGLIWDHLLDTAWSYPWMDELRAQAATAAQRVETARRRQAEREAERWAGPPPSDRVRELHGTAQALAQLDRPLLDRIEALPGARQRATACWAARRAMRVAGLEQIGWIAEALAEADAGRPLPPLSTERSGGAAFDRLLSDPAVPHTTVSLPPAPNTVGGHREIEVLQQAVALPALLALAAGDPLAAAVGAVHHAALAHGDDRARFLAEAHLAVR